MKNIQNMIKNTNKSIIIYIKENMKKNMKIMNIEIIIQEIIKMFMTNKQKNMMKTIQI